MSTKTTKAGADKAPATLEEALQVIETLEASLKVEKEASAQLVADLNDLKTEAETLKAQAESDAEDLNSQIKNLSASLKESEKSEAKIGALEAELEDAAEVIEELKLRLKEADSGKSDKPLVTIDKVTYKVMSGMVKKKKSYTAADIAADKVLAAELLEKGSTILKPVK